MCNHHHHYNFQSTAGPRPLSQISNCSHPALPRVHSLPLNFLISSFHGVNDLPLLLVPSLVPILEPSLGSYSVTLVVHQLSAPWITCPQPKSINSFSLNLSMFLNMEYLFPITKHYSYHPFFRCTYKIKSALSQEVKE